MDQRLQILRTLRSPHQASRLGIGFCPGRSQNRRHYRRRFGAGKYHSGPAEAARLVSGRSFRREQNEIAERFIRQLLIQTPSAEKPSEFLSGGNQQKVLLSCWLLTKPQFLILDELTPRRIDVGAHAEIIFI
ncbi:ATP-binding cassette domain-containing protein [Klebsiella pneumoniae]|nr:ATP-binding cassette domain-containing protein [Klebsiella pneumoniae]